MENAIKKKGPSKVEYILSNVKRAITAQSIWPDKVKSFFKAILS